MSFEKILTKRQYGSTHIVFWEKFWPKDNTVQPILSFKKTFTKIQYGFNHIVLQENVDESIIRFIPYSLFGKFDEKTKQFNTCSLYWKFWTKDNTVPPILSFKKIFTKRQYGSTHIAFWENFHQKTIWFKLLCLIRKSRIKDNTVQPILSSKKIFTKRQYGSTHIVF